MALQRQDIFASTLLDRKHRNLEDLRMALFDRLCNALAGDSKIPAMHVVPIAENVLANFRELRLLTEDIKHADQAIRAEAGEEHIDYRRLIDDHTMKTL